MQGIHICDVEVGVYPDAKTALESLEALGYSRCDWGEDILGKTVFDRIRRSIPLFVLTNEELDLPDGADYRDIIRPGETTLGKALQFGFKKCPGEVAPALLVQHPDTSEEIVGEGLAVGMDVIAANCSWSSILALRKKRLDESKPMLSATRAIWHLGKHRFLFTR